MSRQKTTTIKIARHPADVTMYRVVQGGRILRDNLETLDDALLWQTMNIWYAEISLQIKNPNEKRKRHTQILKDTL